MTPSHCALIVVAAPPHPSQAKKLLKLPSSRMAALDGELARIGAAMRVAERTHREHVALVDKEKKWDEKLGDLEKSWIKARNAKLVQLERELASHHRMREGLKKNPAAVKFLQNSAAEAMLREGASEVEAAAAACKQLRELKPRTPARAPPTRLARACAEHRLGPLRGAYDSRSGAQEKLLEPVVCAKREIDMGRKKKVSEMSEASLARLKNFEARLDGLCYALPSSFGMAEIATKVSTPAPALNYLRSGD